ncbi:DUF1642 domain-containing protein [Lactococcus lactis]|nr:DUF1642 domain-containing protein [Lactococcus lactis]
MTKFEEKKKEAYEKASIKHFGNADGSRAMRYLLNELENAGLLKEQQPLPVVPEDVAEWIEILKTKGLKPLKNPETYGETGFTEEKLQNIVFWISEHQEDYMRAWLDGYQVEKPQLFKLIFPNSTAVLQKDGELNSFADTVYKRYLIENAMTEQEIKSIDERYWQFAVPVEDGE